MSSIKEQRTRLFQEKLQELGDIGTKERSEDAAPFYDKPTTMEQAVRKTEKEENFKEEACSPLQFTDYEACYLCPQSRKGAKSGFTIRTEVLHTLRHVLSDLRAETTLSSYIERILVAHLRAYQELLNKEIAKRKREQTIQL